MKLIPTSTQPVTITLYQGVPFSNNYEEHTLLSNKFKYHTLGGSDINIGSIKTAFLDMRKDGINYYFPRTTLVQSSYNFAYGDGLVTSVVLELTGNTINSNYMKVVAGTDVYYYFITGITQKNESVYLLNLELDVFMTYSEEFLDNIKDKPVMTERKHCRRILKADDLAVRKINPVCYNQESTFSQLKSNVIKEFTPLEFKDFINGNNDYNEIMGKECWAYIIVGKNSSVIPSSLALKGYEENGIHYPFSVACVPLKNMLVDVNTSGGQVRISCVGDAQHQVLDKFVKDTAVQKIIVSPFPPFKECSNITNMSVYPYSPYPLLMEVGGTTTLIEYELPRLSEAHIYTGTNYTGTDMYLLYECYEQAQVKMRDTGFFLIMKGYGGKFSFNEISNYFVMENLDCIDENWRGEYKLQISPFKDLRMSSYYGGEYRVPTQMLFLRSDRNYTIKPSSIVSNNAESNSYFNYVDVYENSVSAKLGTANAVSYNLPTGSNAELLFNQTQSEQYTNSKVVSAITNGLKVIGGALAVVFGSGLGKVGGATAIASGVTGEINTFTDWSAKMEDLKNTPNSYTFGGSSFSYDYAVANSQEQTLLPYLITYGVSDVEYKMANEFLYHYGYDYNCETYFETTITDRTDNIFERQLFNYVKIREDIVTKLVGSNLPLKVAEKMNEVLNAGIKFWNFFGFDFNDSGDVVDIIDNYFQKSKYCNAELIQNNL